MRQHKVKRICMVCKSFLGYADWESDEPDAVTHTICPPDTACYKTYMSGQMEIAERLKSAKNS